MGHIQSQCRDTQKPMAYKNQEINRGFNPNFNRNMQAQQAPNNNLAANIGNNF